MIEMIGVHKKLGDKVVLAGMDLKVENGETVVIIGRSGAGKSVTLKHLVGLMQPDSGQVLIEGRDITRMSENEILEVRKTFGMLFQSGALLNSLTVGQNVALPLVEHENLDEETVRRIVREKLKLVDMEGVEDVMPSDLSGGMKKRVGLARAIVRNPQVLLYDEPTSGLDPVMSSQINDLILSMKTNLRCTAIVVTHDMQSAFKIADKIAMLYQGRIVKFGPPEEFKTTCDPLVRQFVTGDVYGPLTEEDTQIRRRLCQPAAPIAK
jgi:phospholipid/cholesterol/gamma-HCH transport system ATP-binding protein